MLQNEIINNLNKFLRNFFNLDYSPLKTNNGLDYKLEGIYEAINYRHNDQEKVKTLHFFADFYVFLEVRFTMDYLNKFISLSVFQGEESCSSKHQLFRAEWDDYDDGRANHPQPHWHITRDKAHLESINALINDKIEEEKASLEIYNFSNETIFDTKKIHFAMSGLWHYNNEGHVHRIDDADKIVAWLRGLLEHVKCELSS